MVLLETDVDAVRLARLDGTRPDAAHTSKGNPASGHDAFLAPLPERRDGAGLGVLVLGGALVVVAVAAWYFLGGG